MAKVKDENINPWNPFFDTNFEAYTESYKWMNEQNFANRQAWDARLYGTWERERTQEWNEYMYDKNNEYNSIGAQIARARAAGVNPNALIGGEYKSAQSNAPQSSPQSPVQASTPSTNASERLTRNAATLVDAAKGAAENFISEKNVSINKKQIDANVERNKHEIALLLKEGNIKEVTYDTLRKNLTWIDDLNYATVQEKVSNVVSALNDVAYKMESLLIQWGQLDINRDVADSDINVNTSIVGVNNATVKEINERTKGLAIDNVWKNTEKFNEQQLQELRILDLDARVQTAKLLGVAMGTSEHEFMYALAKKGLLPSFIKTVVIPNARAQMKPADLQRTFERNIGNNWNLGVLGKWGLDNNVRQVEHFSIAPYGFGVLAPDSIPNP